MDFFQSPELPTQFFWNVPIKCNEKMSFPELLKHSTKIIYAMNLVLFVYIVVMNIIIWD